jgi:cellulose synthase/poly-beta-1,6-N-acetylglucosamine synthase-like glycosyltransferase
MIDLEIPIGKRTLSYRLFEMLPALLSYGAFILLIVLSLVSPLLAAIYLMLIIITVLVRAVVVVYHTLTGHSRLVKTQKVDWAERLADFEDPATSYELRQNSRSKAFGMLAHVDNLRLATADPEAFPKPSDIYNLVIIATYNETYEVLRPTIQSLIDSTYDNRKLIVVLTYEARAGEATESNAIRLEKEFKNTFYKFIITKHPEGLPGETVGGKGGNITFAGNYMKTWLAEEGIEYKNVIVTTLDSDNHPHRAYFDYLTYEFVVNEDRKHTSFQPIAMFTNNIWDVPAPMRVVATGNTFWSIISSMRPHILRNFAAHSQPMEALVEMGFWSTRTVVEDGHQFWRSYFHFSGNYSVKALYVPIYQDAVLDVTYGKTLKAQFKQLRRWMYGASDIPYVAVHLFTSKRNVPFWSGFLWFVRALDGYVTAASISIIVAVGGWIPLLINNQAYHDVVAHQLPDVVSTVQQIALIGLIVMVFMSFQLLPPRPERYKRHRTIGMVLQWVLMPLTAIVYLSFAALNAQTRLATGRYLQKFEVTTKAVHRSRRSN